MTWSWENLLFACFDCNTDKGSKFPLAPGSPKLGPGRQPPADEAPLLIDLSREDPRLHIRFVPSRGGKWFPEPRAGSVRRAAMLEALVWDRMGMRQPGLVQAWQDHVEAMQPSIRAIEAALESNDQVRIQQVWERQTARWRVVRAEHVGSPSTSSIIISGARSSSLGPRARAHRGDLVK
ncbi:MAG: hypothetical protein HC927_07835 [Deltaproteobacteria bacterium]|nr:hypothetical protein [Deltaproteobacteria bacterium]